jgi:hypothetical protein
LFTGSLGSAGQILRSARSFSVHLAVRIRPYPKNKPDFFDPVQTPYKRYTRVSGTFSTARLLPNHLGNGHTPRKLPAFSSLKSNNVRSSCPFLEEKSKVDMVSVGNKRRNLPLHRVLAQLGRNFPNRRFVRVSEISPYVNRYLHFSIHKIVFTRIMENRIAKAHKRGTSCLKIS